MPPNMRNTHDSHIHKCVCIESLFRDLVEGKLLPIFFYFTSDCSDICQDFILYFSILHDIIDYESFLTSSSHLVRLAAVKKFHTSLTKKDLLDFYRLDQIYDRKMSSDVINMRNETIFHSFGDKYRVGDDIINNETTHCRRKLNANLTGPINTDKTEKKTKKRKKYSKFNNNFKDKKQKIKLDEENACFFRKESTKNPFDHPCEVRRNEPAPIVGGYLFPLFNLRYSQLHIHFIQDYKNQMNHRSENRNSSSFILCNDDICSKSINTKNIDEWALYKDFALRTSELSKVCIKQPFPSTFIHENHPQIRGNELIEDIPEPLINPLKNNTCEETFTRKIRSKSKEFFNQVLEPLIESRLSLKEKRKSSNKSKNSFESSNLIRNISNAKENLRTLSSGTKYDIITEYSEKTNMDRCTNSNKENIGKMESFNLPKNEHLDVFKTKRRNIDLTNARFHKTTATMCANVADDKKRCVSGLVPESKTLFIPEKNTSYNIHSTQIDEDQNKIKKISTGKIKTKHKSHSSKECQDSNDLSEIRFKNHLFNSDQRYEDGEFENSKPDVCINNTLSTLQSRKCDMDILNNHKEAPILTKPNKNHLENLLYDHTTNLKLNEPFHIEWPKNQLNLNSKDCWPQSDTLDLFFRMNRKLHISQIFWALDLEFFSVKYNYDNADLKDFIDFSKVDSDSYFEGNSKSCEDYRAKNHFLLSKHHKDKLTDFPLNPRNIIKGFHNPNYAILRKYDLEVCTNIIKMSCYFANKGIFPFLRESDIDLEIEFEAGKTISNRAKRVRKTFYNGEFSVESKNFEDKKNKKAISIDMKKSFLSRKNLGIIMDTTGSDSKYCEISPNLGYESPSKYSKTNKDVIPLNSACCEVILHSVQSNLEKGNKIILNNIARPQIYKNRAEKAELSFKKRFVRSMSLDDALFYNSHKSLPLEDLISLFKIAEPQRDISGVVSLHKIHDVPNLIPQISNNPLKLRNSDAKNLLHESLKYTHPSNIKKHSQKNISLDNNNINVSLDSKSLSTTLTSTKNIKCRSMQNMGLICTNGNKSKNRDFLNFEELDIEKIPQFSGTNSVDPEGILNNSKPIYEESISGILESDPLYLNQTQNISKELALHHATDISNEIFRNNSYLNKKIHRVMVESSLKYNRTPPAVEIPNSSCKKNFKSKIIDTHRVKIRNYSIYQNISLDPNTEIRSYVVLHLLSGYRLVPYLQDSSPSVRIAALKKMNTFEFINNLEPKNYLRCFHSICDLVCDSNLEIRLLSMRALRFFTKLSLQDIKSLFVKIDDKDKITPGAFIHGFEDENQLVRYEAINTMCELSQNYEIATECLEFLTDALNDEVVTVKEFGSSKMLQLLNKHKMIANDVILDYLFCNIREKSAVIKHNVFYILCLLHYPEIKVILDRLHAQYKTKIDVMYTLKALSEIIKRNIEDVYQIFIKDFKNFEETTFTDIENLFNLTIFGELVLCGKRDLINSRNQKRLFFYELTKIQTEKNMQNIAFTSLKHENSQLKKSNNETVGLGYAKPGSIKDKTKISGYKSSGDSKNHYLTEKSSPYRNKGLINTHRGIHSLNTNSNRKSFTGILPGESNFSNMMLDFDRIVDSNPESKIGNQEIRFEGFSQANQTFDINYSEKFIHQLLKLYIRKLIENKQNPNPTYKCAKRTFLGCQHPSIIKIIKMLHKTVTSGKSDKIFRFMLFFDACGHISIVENYLEKKLFNYSDKNQGYIQKETILAVLEFIIDRINLYSQKYCICMFSDSCKRKFELPLKFEFKIETNFPYENLYVIIKTKKLIRLKAYKSNCIYISETHLNFFEFWVCFKITKNFIRITSKQKVLVSN